LLDRLPHKKDFLLSLVNNNYSQHTLEGYARDLLIFEMFLNRYNIEFNNVSKLSINEYKGYLRSGLHIQDLESLKNKIEDKEIEIESSQMHKQKNIILNEALGTDVLRKSRSKGSRMTADDSNGLNSRSVNRMLSTLRSFLAFLIDIDFLVPISPSAIKMVKTVRKESQVAPMEDLIELLEAPAKYESDTKVILRNRALLEVLFSTGMRVSELVGLDLEDMRFNRNDKKISDNKIYILGKGKKQRYVYLTDRAIFHLEQYLEIRDDDFPAVFIPYKGTRTVEMDVDGIRISQRYVQSMIKKYRKYIGIITPTTPHSLRHGFATYLAEKGANPAAIQRLLGHESLETTTRYVHSSDKFAENSHHEYHPLPS
jgi:site-specific recombinase XerD